MQIYDIFTKPPRNCGDLTQIAKDSVGYNFSISSFVKPVISWMVFISIPMAFKFLAIWIAFCFSPSFTPCLCIAHPRWCPCGWGQQSIEKTYQQVGMIAKNLLESQVRLRIQIFDKSFHNSSFYEILQDILYCTIHCSWRLLIMHNRYDNYLFLISQIKNHIGSNIKMSYVYLVCRILFYVFCNDL